MMNSGDTALHLYVIDDDDAARYGILQLVKSMKMEVDGFASAEDFLSSYDRSPGMMICDVRMPGMSGLDLQKSLLEEHIFMPTVLMTGFCRTHIVVDAIRNGATTVLEKPFTAEDFWLAVHQGLSDYRTGIGRFRHLQSSRKRLEQLTASEKDVLRHLKAGLTNKVIAKELDVSVRTIVLRRKKILEKLDVDNLIELFRLVTYLEVDEANRCRSNLLSKSAVGMRH